MVSLRFFLKTIGFVSTIIIARLLTPKDFGIVAIAMSLYALIDIFGAFGVDTVLIHKQETTVDQFNTAWTINFCFGLLGFILISCAAYPISVFYGEPNLIVVFFSIAFLFVFNGSKNIGVVEFRKNLTFDKEFKFQIVPKLIGTIVTISMAYWLRNYWALIIGTLVWKGSESINSYFVHPFRPHWSVGAFKELFSFSKYLVINNILQFMNTKSLELILGRILSVAFVGLYSISQEIATLPTVEFVAPINRAVYPGYAIVANKPEELKDIYVKTIGLIAFIVIPFSIGIISISEMAIPILLGEKWKEIIPLVQILAFSSLFVAFNSNTGYVFYAKGQPQILTKFSILKLSLVIPGSIVAAIYYDLFAVGLVLCSVSMFMTFLFQRVIINEFSLTFGYFLNTYGRPAFGSLIMFLCVNYFIIIKLKKIIPLVPTLFLSILAGIFIYLSTTLLLWHFCGRPNSTEKLVIEWIKTNFFRRIIKAE